MTNSRTTKRALLNSAVALLLCFAMLLGTTFAWFTDSVTSAGNIIKSGNLDIEMYWADGTKAVPTTDADWTDASEGAIFDYDKWEPGYTEVRHIKISNVGSLALKYQLSIAANGEATDLADVIDVYYVDPAVQVADRAALANAPKLGTLTEVLANISTTASGNLEAGQSHTVTLALKMQESAGNEYQGKSIGTDFRVVLAATQKDFESDSFGTDYDAGLDPETTYVSTFTELKNAARNGGKVALNSDLQITDKSEFFYGNYVTAVYNDMILDLNGHTITIDVPADNVADAPVLFYVYSEGASLTIVGDGDVVAKNDAFLVFPRGVSEGVYIYGGNYYNIDETSGTKNDINAIVYSQTNSNIHIYGGTFTFKNVNGHCGAFNVYDNSGAEITLYEGVLLSNSSYYKGSDAYEIHLAEGCYLKKVQIDGEEWWQVTKAEDTKIINTFADMVDVCKNGGKMVLAKDITYTAENTEMMIDGSIFLVNGKNVTVDLNGHDIIIDENATQVTGAIFFVGNPGGHIDIVGDGEITVKNGLAPIVWVLQSGTANIYGGTFASNSVSNEAMFYSQGNGGVINVYGGKYTYDLDRHLNGGFNVSDQAGNALRIILHEGVLLSRPEYSQHLQGTTNGEQNRIQLAEGCTLEEVVIDSETWYQVVKA